MKHSHIKAHLAAIAFALAIPVFGSAQAQPAPPKAPPKLESDIKWLEWREAPSSKNSHLPTDLVPRYAKWGAAKRWVLATDDARGVYAPLGFALLKHPLCWMSYKSNEET
jgi:hypothetical protein